MSNVKLHQVNRLGLNKNQILNNSDESLPTISFKDKKLKSLKENTKYLLKFLISGKYEKIGGKKYTVQLVSDSELVSFSTTRWNEVEKGWALETYILTKSPETINISFKVDGKDTNSLNLSIISKQITKPEKCICKKTYWSADDLKYIVTELRKKDRILKQREFDKRGNPYFVDEKGNKVPSNDRGKSPKEGYGFYYKETSFYDRNDDIDGKPLKDRIFFYDSDLSDKSINNNLDSKYANYEMFSKYLNQTFSKYKINKCIQKIHFLAQSYVETNRFRTTIEHFPRDYYSGGKFYGGRGMKQITHDYNYLAYYDITKGKGKNLYSLYITKRLSNFDPKKGIVFVESVVEFNKRTNNEFISLEEMDKFNEFVNQISKDIYWAFDSAGWYWEKNKINKFATDTENSIIVVSAKINNPSASDNPSGKGINELSDRKLYFELLKQILDFENCK